MKQVQSEIEIDAPPSLVWQVLTDFAAFPEWNPFVKHMEGELVVGGHLTIVLKPGPFAERTVRTQVLCVDPGQSLIWRHPPHIPWLFDVMHGFTLEALPGERTRFVQRAVFRGLFGSLLARKASHERCGLEEMNRALKVAAEWAARPGPGCMPRYVSAMCPSLARAKATGASD